MESTNFKEGKADAQQNVERDAHYAVSNKKYRKHKGRRGVPTTKWKIHAGRIISETSPDVDAKHD